jgi:diaminohydroxyphosphoribosylaminopyrimidine deaminase / 5-amino-6-(5-phosphoribosylamino)uracil reductase
MAMCLRLAEKGSGHVSPNPLVGAVLVKGGRVVARGVHRQFGGSHAEVECLHSFKGDTRNATLYVNLEPCSHHGKTPPCVDLIIDSGIRTVVVGMQDPNPIVAGKGLRKLRNAGVRVVKGVLGAEAESLNRHFITHITKRRPFVHVKIAQTLDGKIAFKRGSPSEISCIESRALVHRWRAEHDAVLVGAGTIRADDPLLTVRLAKGRDPALIVLDAALSLKPNYKVFRNAEVRRVFIVTTKESAKKHWRKIREFTSAGVTVLLIVSKNNYILPKQILREMYKLGVGSVLVEGGSDVFTQFVQSGLVDLLSVFVSAKIYPTGFPAFSQNGYGPHQRSERLGRPELVKRIGTDVLLQYSLSKGI